MATRFYFAASGTSKLNSLTADAGWEQTGSIVRRPMYRKGNVPVLTALTDSAAITIPITTTQQIAAWQMCSDDVFLPFIFTTTYTFSLVIRCSENATTNNAFLAYSLRAVTADGRVLGTLTSSLANTGTEYAVTASAATRIFSAVALSSLTCTEPFRMVLEIGSHAQAPSAAGSFIQRVGNNAASDFALTSALTTDLNPWMELSCDLLATPAGNNYQHARGAGLSFSERTR